MSEVVGKIFEWLKSPRQCAPVFLAALAFLFFPVPFLQKSGLEFMVRYRAGSLLLAILSGAVLATEGLYHLWRRWKNKREAEASRQIAIQNLKGLSPGEKGLILRYFLQASDTQYLSTSDGVVGGLRAKGLIYRSANSGHHSRIGPIFAHNLQPWVREYIDDHPEVLEGANDPTPPSSPFRSLR